MKAIVKTGLVFGLLLTLSTFAHAGPLPASDALFLGTINDLHDQDSETVVNAAGQSIGLSTPVAPGDFLLSVFQVENVNRTNPSATNFLGNTSYQLLTGVGLLEIQSVTPTGSTLDGVPTYNYVFTAPTSTQWTTVTTGAGATVTNPTGTILSTYNQPTQVSPPAGYTASASGYYNPNGAPSLADALNAAALLPGDSLLWNLGFTGTPDPTLGDGSLDPDATKGQGWHVQATANTEGGLGILVAFGDGPTFRGGLSLIPPPGPLVANIPLGPTTDFGGNTFAPGYPKSQALIEGSINAFSSNNPLALGSGSDTYIDPVAVPEPASLVTFSVSALCTISLAGVVRRRRRRITGMVAV